MSCLTPGYVNASDAHIRQRVTSDARLRERVTSDAHLRQRVASDARLCQRVVSDARLRQRICRITVDIYRKKYEIQDSFLMADISRPTNHSVFDFDSLKISLTYFSHSIIFVVFFTSDENCFRDRRKSVCVENYII